MLKMFGFPGPTQGRRGFQGASRASPGKSGVHARGEGERVLALESREGTREKRLSLPVWVNTIQSVEGLNRTER